MIGLIGVTLNHWSFYASLTKADPVTAALILATAPIFTAFINYLLFKEAKCIFLGALSMLSFAGVTLVIMKKILLKSVQERDTSFLLCYLSLFLWLWLKDTQTDSLLES
jgi:drug/metabolite transporter (DMT)-like permease